MFIFFNYSFLFFPFDYFFLSVTHPLKPKLACGLHSVFFLCRGCGARLQHHLSDAGRNPPLHHQGHGHLHLPPAPRCVCRHRTLQLPGYDPSVDVPHGHGVWQHLPAEAVRASANLCHAAGQDAAGRWGSRWDAQRHPRPTCW